MTSKTYTTKVTRYNLAEDENPILGIEVPYAFIDDLDLKENELLNWEIDLETRTATITKTNIIIND